MKILLVCGALSGGGAERVALNLAEQFQYLGHDVIYYYWRAARSDVYLPNNIKYQKSATDSIFHRITGLVRLAREQEVECIISFTDIPNILVGLCHKSGFLRKCLFLPTVHNDLKYRDEGIRFQLKDYLYRYLHKKLLRSAGRVIAVSGGVKKSLSVYYGVPGDLISVIYNPVLKKVRADRKKAIEGKIRLVAVGRLVEQKDYPTMLKALAVVNKKAGMVMHIYGAGPLDRKLNELVERLDIRDVVQFKGYDSELHNKLSSYDALVMSSKWEGFGNVLVEALDAGLYVVATDCPSGPAEILKCGRYGTLTPVADHDRMASAILDLHYAKPTPESEHEELIDHLEQFSSEIVAEQYLEVLRCLKNVP